MTEKEKNLLLKDLSARLVYGVLFMVPGISEPVELLAIKPKCDKPLEIDDGPDERSSTYRKLEECKPYLRSMSSLTSDELEEIMPYFDVLDENYVPHEEWCYRGIDKFNEHHVDYRGLIPMGLALEAPEGMYNF